MAARNDNMRGPQFSSNEEREKALANAMAQIQKQFGKGAVMKLGDDNAMLNIEAISTGSILELYQAFFLLTLSKYTEHRHGPHWYRVIPPICSCESGAK